jgi:hypothetical protein
MNIQFFVEFSGHNLGSSQTSGFRIQCLHYNPVWTTFAQMVGGGGGGGVNYLKKLYFKNKKKEKKF